MLSVDYHAYKVQFDYDSIYHAGEKAYTATFDVDRTLAELSYEDLLGFDTKEEEGNDSFAFALKAVHRFRSEELTKLSEYMEYRPIEVVRKTIQATTQLVPNQCSR